MLIKVCKELYSKNSLLKAAYHFTDNYYIYLDTDEKYYVVDIKQKDSSVEELCEGDFMNELLAQVTREEVFKKTSDIRSLILGRAFASTIIEENNIKTDNLQTDENGIFKDWFNDET